MSLPTYEKVFYPSGGGNANTHPAINGTISVGATLSLAAVSLTGAIASTSTVTATVTVATAALGTVRAVYGKAIASHANPTSGNLVGVRGEVNCATSVDGGLYFYGAQGKFVASTGFVLNHADSRVCGALAQLDISVGTYTTGQLSGLWVDMGGSASASAISTQGGGQCNILRLQNTTGMKVNAMIYGYSLADYVMELGAPGGTMAWLATSAGSAANKWLVINVGGTVYKIALYATA